MASPEIDFRSTLSMKIIACYIRVSTPEENQAKQRRELPRDTEKCRMRVGKKTCVWREGEIFVFDDTYKHEVWNETPDERVVLIFDFDRPMRFWGRRLHQLFISLLKLTAYYQEPKRKIQNIEDRFEAATLRASANLEKMSDPEN